MRGAGGLPPRRPDQHYGPLPPGLTPGARGIFRGRLVIVQGAGGGEFVYDASGNLRSANVGQVTTDPIQGITCQQGFSTFNGFGAVINLLSTSKGAFFQYLDNNSATQGALILSTASVSGTDPVTGTGYPAGQQGVNPAFGSFTQLLGSAILFGVGVLFTRNASVGVSGGSGANPPYLETDSPEQTTASHAALRLEGASPDGTKPAQALLAAVAGSGAITRATNALLEIQGTAALANASAPASASGNVQAYSNSGQLATVNPQGLALNVQGAQSDLAAFTVTAATFQQFSKAWSIPANDAVVGAVYRIRIVGNGTQGSTGQGLNIAGQIGGVNFGTASRINSGFAATSAAFAFWAEIEIVCVTTGTSGTFQCSKVAYAGDASGDSGLSVNDTGASLVTVNTTIANTFEAICDWTSTTGAPTVTCRRSVFERAV